MITVLIADDQTMFGSALASLIDEEEDLEGSSEDSSDGETVKNNTKNDVEKVDALK